MSSAPTIENPLAPTPRCTNDGAVLCWKRTQTVWATVPAPWGDDPDGWIARQNKRLVFSGDKSRPDGVNPTDPFLQVFAVGESEPSDAKSVLVGELSSGFGRPVWYFLCDWPALPRVVTEFTPLLKFHQ
jgi:hypothetical protein